MTDRLTELAILAGRGDQAALVRFVQDSRPVVWRFCAARGGAQAADDLTQETYTRAFAALDRFEGRSSAQTWLLGIARHVSADAVRRAQRRRRLEQRVLHHSGTEVLTEGSGTGLIELDQLVEALPDERREAFVLTQVVGLDYQQAADVVGCPIGTIRSRVARARRDLIAAVAVVVLVVAGIGVAVPRLGTADPAPQLRAVDGVVTAVEAGSPAAVYLAVVNDGGDDRLLGGHVVGTGTLAVHTFEHHHGVEVMTARDHHPVASQATTLLRPDGGHLMIEQAPLSLRPGDRVDLELVFERSGSVRVTIPVVDADDVGDRLTPA